MASTRDLHFLHHALRVGARHLGRTWPNPSVGCVLVREGQVIATGTTEAGGRPHAETQALARAGALARGATAYVTLEPCAHHGHTPPCAQALIDAGVARVVIGCEDPDPRVRGKGSAMLRAAGIEVVELDMPQAQAAHRGFFRRLHHGLPLVAMKLATSLDGQMRDAQGASQWITGERARAHGHGLRATMDAVLTGIGTVLADDPRLTARVPGLAHRTVRVVADRQLRLPLTSQLVRSVGAHPVWVITTATGVEQAASHATELREKGVEIFVLEDGDMTPRAMLQTLGKAGITRLLVEAGPQLSTAFLAARCVDTLHWYRAPLLLGGDAGPAVGALSVQLAAATRATPTQHISLGVDALDVYEMPSCLPD